MAHGHGGKGKGKPTHRSRNYLQRYGYPSERELRREAQGLAGASVPTIRSVRRPYQEQMQSTRDFLAAVQAALADSGSQVGSAYDSAIGQSQAVDQAAQTRLSSLGLGTDSAGVQASVGARGDSATQNLISNAAAAKNYAAQLPAVAAGSASRQQEGLQKSMLDALQNRRDALSQAFFQALSQVKSSALQEAGMVQSGQQFNQQMRQQNQQFAQSFGLQQQQYNEGVREFNVSQRNARRAAGAEATTSEIHWLADFEAKNGFNPYTGKKVNVPGGGGGNAHPGFTDTQWRAGLAGAAKILSPPGNHRFDSKTDSYKDYTQLDVVQKGVLFTDAIQLLTSRYGLSPLLAEAAAARLYASYQGAPRNSLAHKAWLSFMDYTHPEGIVASQNAHRHR